MQILRDVENIDNDMKKFRYITFIVCTIGKTGGGDGGN